jgi:type IV secretory pathway VirB2 component (pilin)
MIRRGKIISLLIFASGMVQSAFARCGGVDYSWGAGSLATMHDFVVTMMLYVLYIIYAIASIVAIIASVQIYIKMTNGEEGVVKSIQLVVGACLFLVGASIVFPAFFGYRV